MALEGPRLFYSLNTDIGEDEPALARALRLAREVEELLEETSSVAPGYDSASGAHSTRIVRAMAASLVDELQAIVRGSRRTTTGVS